MGAAAAPLLDSESWKLGSQDATKTTCSQGVSLGLQSEGYGVRACPGGHRQLDSSRAGGQGRDGSSLQLLDGFRGVAWIASHSGDRLKVPELTRGRSNRQVCGTRQRLKEGEKSKVDRWKRSHVLLRFVVRGSVDGRAKPVREQAVAQRHRWAGGGESCPPQRCKYWNQLMTGQKKTPPPNYYQ